MNATCPAGIPQPQRVSDLGRLLNYEITVTLVFNTSMAPAHLQGAFSNICMAPVHLQGRPHLAMCEAVHHSHTGLRVSTNFQGGNFLTKWRFQRNVAFSHLASRDVRRRMLRVPFGTTQEEFSFDIQQQVLLPALSSQSAARRSFSANSPHTVSRTMPSRFKPITQPTCRSTLNAHQPQVRASSRPHLALRLYQALHPRDSQPRVSTAMRCPLVHEMPRSIDGNS